MRFSSTVFAIAVAFGAFGCDRSRDSDAGVAVVAVDTELAAFLSAARALHHEANVHEQGDDLRAAAMAVSRVPQLSRPRKGQPEVDEVLADAYARLADVRLRLGDIDGAASAAAEGLGYAAQPTYFRGHLLEVQGTIEETRASRLADGGARDQANAARKAAIVAFEQAVLVQEQVIKALADGGAKKGKDAP